MKIFLTLMAIMSLVLMSFVTGVGEETSTGAVLTVNEFIDITLGGTIPINFGSDNPGTNDNPAGGAVTVTIEATTNVDTDTFLKGDDWVTPAALAISNVKFDGDGAINANETNMATTYPAANNGLFENEVCPCGGAAKVKSVFFYLSIPAGQQAGTYTSTSIFFKTVTDGDTP